MKNHDLLRAEIKSRIDEELDKHGVVILPPLDIVDSLFLMRQLEYLFDTVILDPWYNKGFGGVTDNYLEVQLKNIAASGKISSHVFFWGFPEIVAPFVDKIPEPLILNCWLTWYYKNNPSVIRGWRSSQNACLHLSTPGAKMYPERFLNQKQLELKKKGKLRYMPGPTSVLDETPADVIEQSLLIGFIGKTEQTGHPSQKPASVFEKILKMTVSDGGTVFDPMSGSGTTGVVAINNGYRAILSDISDEFTTLAEKRLNVKRINLEKELNLLIEGGMHNVAKYL